MALPEALEQVPLIAGAVRSLKALDAAVTEFAQRAFLSELTDLPNRAAFDAVAETSDLQLLGPGAAVAFIDLTGFKAINDNHGYEAGNVCITESGHVLAKVCALAEAMAFHFSGDEFVALVAPGRVSRFKAAFAQQMASMSVHWQQTPIAVRASAGLAMPDGVVTIWELRRRAEKACKYAKRQNSPMVKWTKEVDAKAPRDVRWRCQGCAAEVSVVLDGDRDISGLCCPACGNQATQQTPKATSLRGRRRSPRL